MLTSGRVGGWCFFEIAERFEVFAVRDFLPTLSKIEFFLQILEEGLFFSASLFFSVSL